MTTIFLGFILLTLVVVGMSVGVLMGRRPITGSCGGIGAALGEKNYTCDICGDDPKKCDEQKNVSASSTIFTKEGEASLSYDATKKMSSSD
jgi:uncharacterized protein